MRGNSASIKHFCFFVKTPSRFSILSKYYSAGPQDALMLFAMDCMASDEA